MVDKAKTETFEVNGENLKDKIKELIHEGNVRRIIIKDKKGKKLMEFPVNVGLLGAVFAAPLVAIGAIAALVKECTIVVVRK